MSVDTYEGCVYGTNPDDPHYKLSASDLESIRSQMKGLPIRVEHERNTIGSVLASDIDSSGRLNIKYALSDDAAGWAAAQLINQGDLPELSLKHTEYGDGRKVPKEVSLVVKGARPDTKIFRNETNGLFCGVEYKNKATPTVQQTIAASAGTVRPTEITPTMSDVSAPEPIKDTSMTVPPATDATPVAMEPVAPADAMASPAGDDQPNAKKARTEGPADTPVTNQEPDHAEILQELTAKLDPASAEKLYNSYGHLMQQVIEGRANMTNLQKENQIMESASERQKEMAKHTAQDVTRVLNDLYKTYGAPGTQITPEDRSVVEKSMMENPSFMSALQPIVVAASAINQRQHEVDQRETNKELLKKQAEISVLQRQMHLQGQMGGHVEAADLWKNVPEIAHEKPVAAAAPMVEVAASGKKAAAPDGKVIPSWLQNQIGNYTSGFQQNRMYKTDFNTTIRAPAQP